MMSFLTRISREPVRATNPLRPRARALTYLLTVENFIQKGRLPHLLFYGPPGTGKTSTILAIARRIYGAKTYKSHILELNASDDRGIDVVREQIKGFAQTRVLFSKGFKLIILDEADMMTQAAQGALRRGEP